MNLYEQPYLNSGQRYMLTVWRGTRHEQDPFEVELAGTNDVGVFVRAVWAGKVDAELQFFPWHAVLSLAEWFVASEEPDA